MSHGDEADSGMLLVRRPYAAGKILKLRAAMPDGTSGTLLLLWFQPNQQLLSANDLLSSSLAVQAD